MLGDVERAADTMFAPLGIVFPPGTVIDEVTDPARVLVAGDPPIAFAYVAKVDDHLHVEQIAVRPEHTRRGVGLALMAAVIERAGAWGVTLTTFRDVPWNAPWYARQGFVELHQPGRELAALIERERQAGLTDLGRRVAMYRAGGSPHNGQAY
jgi:GNAT superfamily N-acetyltransferase